MCWNTNTVANLIKIHSELKVLYNHNAHKCHAAGYIGDTFDFYDDYSSNKALLKQFQHVFNIFKKESIVSYTLRAIRLHQIFRFTHSYPYAYILDDKYLSETNVNFDFHREKLTK